MNFFWNQFGTKVYKSFWTEPFSKVLQLFGVKKTCCLVDRVFALESNRRWQLLGIICEDGFPVAEMKQTVNELHKHMYMCHSVSCSSSERSLTKLYIYISILYREVLLVITQIIILVKLKSSIVRWSEYFGNLLILLDFFLKYWWKPHHTIIHLFIIAVLIVMNLFFRWIELNGCNSTEQLMTKKNINLNQMTGKIYSSNK